MWYKNKLLQFSGKKHYVHQELKEIIPKHMNSLIPPMMLSVKYQSKLHK